MSVKTSLPAEQQVAGGNYGIIVQAQYYNAAYKNQEVQSDDDLVTRTYILDVNNMQGQPYKYIVKNRQYTIFAIDGNNLKSIQSIEAFCNGFPVTKENQPNDIFLSDFELEFMEPLTETELEGGSLKILTPNGAYFKSSNDDTIYLQAELKIKGKKVNFNSQNVDFYWFIKDTTVTSSDNENFSSYAGAGWRCLNQHTTYNGVTKFTPEGYRKDLRPTMAPNEVNTFKCVAVTNNTTFSGIINIENKAATNSIEIVSSAGTKFYFDTGVTTLTCNVITDVTTPLVYHWGYRSADETLVTVEDQSKSIEVRISEATNLVTYECTVTSMGTYIGAAAITLTNGTSEKEYTLIINNGTQVFKYNEYGVSPTNKASDEPIIIPSLSFDIYNDQGQIVTPRSDTEKIKMCDIKWVWPDEDYTMLQHKTFDLVDDLVINPTNNGNLLRHVLKNAANLTFEIKNRYDADATDNTIRLEVSFQGHNLVASTNFTFVKEGENGTNGTKYISKIVPFNNKYEKIYLENNNIYGWYRDIDKVYNVATGEEKITEKYNFTRISTNQPLKAQLWDGNAAPLYDSRTNTTLAPELTWEMVDIGRDTIHNAEISSNGILAPRSYNNVSTVIKTTIETNELSQQAKNYYATYPLDIARTPNSNIHAIVTGGFRECMYNNDGTRSSFSSKPFELRIFKDGVEQIVDNSRISWYTSWYTNRKNTQLQGQNGVEINPPSVYDSETTNNYIVATYSDNDGDYTIILSIYLYLNRYGLAAMNDWDGTSIKINEEGDQYILAPQIGAGQKDSSNRFTGITMGKSFNANGNGQREIGLMGFASGQRSIFLDAETGKAQFGLPGHGQITLAPYHYGAAPAGSIFSWGFYNHDTTGRPVSEAKSGLLIDLETPTIRFGSGDFEVDANGHLTAKGGGTIAGWEISDDSLSSQDKNTILYSKGTGENVERISVGKQKFVIYADGSFKAANNNFKVDKTGKITSTSGTIGGWNISKTELKGGNVTLKSSGEINVNNAFIVHNNGSFEAANNNFKVNSNGKITSTSGTIGGWNIGANSLSNNSISIDASNGISCGSNWSISNAGKANFNDITAKSNFTIGDGANSWTGGAYGGTMNLVKGILGNTSNIVSAASGIKYAAGQLMCGTVLADDGTTLAKYIPNLVVDNLVARKSLTVNGKWVFNGGGYFYNDFAVFANAAFGKNVSIVGDLIAGGQNGKTVKVVFSDNTWLEFNKGVLTGGRDHNGNNIN